VPKVPSPADLEGAAEILNAGRKVAILAGQGALHAGEELEQVAEKLAAPIVKALSGKAVVPDDSPYTTGPIGLLGTRPSQEAMENCDTILIVGSAFPYLEYMPKPGQREYKLTWIHSRLVSDSRWNSGLSVTVGKRSRHCSLV
jgi:pyruvate dehydrogenase (quinone)/pyruvate oxidase